jgi:hypothetical protein
MVLGLGGLHSLPPRPRKGEGIVELVFRQQGQFFLGSRLVLCAGAEVDYFLKGEFGGGEVAEIFLSDSEFAVGFASDVGGDSGEAVAEEVDEAVAVVAKPLPDDFRKLLGFPELALDVEGGGPHHIDVGVAGVEGDGFVEVFAGRLEKRQTLDRFAFAREQTGFDGLAVAEPDEGAGVVRIFPHHFGDFVEGLVERGEVAFENGKEFLPKLNNERIFFIETGFGVVIVGGGIDELGTGGGENRGDEKESQQAHVNHDYVG